MIRKIIDFILRIIEIILDFHIWAYKSPDSLIILFFFLTIVLGIAGYASGVFEIMLIAGIIIAIFLAFFIYKIIKYLKKRK